MCSFSARFWGWKPRPSVCMVGTLLTEPLPLPRIIFFSFFILSQDVSTIEVLTKIPDNFYHLGCLHSPDSIFWEHCFGTEPSWVIFFPEGNLLILIGRVTSSFLWFKSLTGTCLHFEPPILYFLGYICLFSLFQKFCYSTFQVFSSICESLHPRTLTKVLRG